jgi:hypothetical protein
MFFSVLFVATSALDPIISFDNMPITITGLMQLFVPSIAPLGIVWAIFHTWGGLINDKVFNFTMYGAFATIILSGIGSLIIASIPNPKFRFSLFTSGLMVGVHSFVIGLFLTIL